MSDQSSNPTDAQILADGWRILAMRVVSHPGTGALEAAREAYNMALTAEMRRICNGRGHFALDPDLLPDVTPSDPRTVHASLMVGGGTVGVTLGFGRGALTERLTQVFRNFGEYAEGERITPRHGDETVQFSALRGEEFVRVRLVGPAQSVQAVLDVFAALQLPADGT